MAKRSAEGGSNQPVAKKVHFEPVNLGPVSSLEEMNMKTLQFQNRKLAQRLEQRLQAESTLRMRIEQLEKRQTQDDAVLNVVNRYWNQLNEDVRVLLQRFDAETADESENINENEATTSFLTELSTWDKQELDEKLANRVLVSKRAVAKILQAFDRLLQRNEKLMQMFREGGSKINEAVLQANIELGEENKRLHSLVTKLEEKHHTTSIKMSQLQDKVTGFETQAAELQNSLHDSEYELNKYKIRSEKLETHLADSLEKVKMCQITAEGEEKNKGHMASITQRRLEDMQRDLEEQRELATNRLQELDKLHHDHKETLQEVEKLKTDIRQLPESVIVETTEYKCLQSQFSVLYNESMQLKTQLDDVRNFLQNSKNTHLRQIEQMEGEELNAQKKLRTELIQLEDMLAQVRKEYEMLRIEFEQNLAANEQTGPINREMRHLITSLQNHNQQLKGDLHRYKKKLKDACAELVKLKKDLSDVQQHRLTLQSQLQTLTAETQIKGDSTCLGNQSEGAEGSSIAIKEEPGLLKPKEEPDTEGDELEAKDSKKDLKREVKSEMKMEMKEIKKEQQKCQESDLVREYKAQLKKAQNEQKEMKLLLDMYKGVAKEQRDKVQLMAAEKRVRDECETLKQQLRKMQESKREDRKKLADEDALRKLKQSEEQIHQLQKQVTAQKQEEEAMLNEMEVTGQAFEDMQEQNIRLIQQLREKDDANFKLMSERIKSNQIHKLSREEKEMLVEQVSTLRTHVDAQNQVVRKLEEKERILQNNLATVEKELSIRQQALEMHKRKAIESAQSAADLKLHLEKYHAQVKEAQQTVAEKTAHLEQEAYKTKRLQEDIGGYRRKIERAKRFELATTADEVLTEEIKEYKEQLTCPSCKVKRKDAVLTKCFHVFCFDCLRTRYETRQRKCPKCNAAFGANDYHRLYLS